MKGEGRSSPSPFSGGGGEFSRFHAVFQITWQNRCVVPLSPVPPPPPKYGSLDPPMTDSYRQENRLSFLSLTEFSSVVKKLWTETTELCDDMLHTSEYGLVEWCSVVELWVDRGAIL